MTDEATRILARLIRNTRTRKRVDDVVTVANQISLLQSEYGSLDKVSEKVGISKGMLRRFLAVYQIDEKVRELVRERKIDSVAFVNQVKNLPPNEQLYLADLFQKREISTDDLKAILPYRKINKKLAIEQIVKNVMETKDIKTYVLIFPKPPGSDESEIKKYFGDLVGEDNIYTVRLKGEMLEVALLKKGKDRIFQVAKGRGLTLKEFVFDMIEELGGSDA